MTIEKGAAWGTPGTVPGGVPACADDRALAASTGPVCLAGGNVHAALGRPDCRRRGEPCTFLPVDGLRVEITAPDGRRVEMTAAGEVSVGSWYGRGGLTVITNAGLHGSLNLTPRSHPNDGRFDMFRLEGSVRLRERRTARVRARTGTHLPHPGMHVSSGTSVTLGRSRRQRLVVDGRRVPGWASVTVTVLPDRFTVVV